jgi:4'-phosphopantetheinyl transferase
MSQCNPPFVFLPGSTGVHIWQADLGLAEDDICKSATLLSEEEMSRALRFHFRRDRNRFIAAHGILRTLLGSYLQVEPSELTFDYGIKEKPSLSHPWSVSGLNFNISHSQNSCLIAVTRNRAIGVDVEYFRDIADLDSISELNFHPNERAALLTIARTDRQGAFFRCWTRKEAFIKAIGQGLSHPLDRFHVSLVEGERDRICPIEHGLGPDWSIWDVPVEPNAAAAVAVDGQVLHLSYQKWTTALAHTAQSRLMKGGVCRNDHVCH